MLQNRLTIDQIVPSASESQKENLECFHHKELSVDVFSLVMKCKCVFK